MKILDLFMGTGSATAPYVRLGHEVHGVELESVPTVPDAGVVHRSDVLDLLPDPTKWLDDNISDGWRPDVIWAGVPCQGFAVPSIGRMWQKDAGGRGVHLPKHPTSELGLRLLDATVTIFKILNPQVYFIENPCAMMRKVMPSRHPQIATPQTVSYCQYGPIMAPSADPPEVWCRKDTDIFCNIDIKPRRCTVRGGEPVVGPSGLPFIPDAVGRPCHEKAQRGAKAGIQRIPGRDPARSAHPKDFALAMALTTLDAIGDNYYKWGIEKR